MKQKPGAFSAWLVLLLACGLSLLALQSCTGSEPEDLFELAHFEERQNNPAHARELYEQITREFPESEFAGRAQKRLEQMEPEVRK